MKLILTTAALALSAAPMLAQAGETGVSHPDPAPITVESDEASPRQSLPATPATHTKPSAYVPYTAPAATRPAIAPARETDPDAGIVTTAVPPLPAEDSSTYHPYTPGLTPRTGVRPAASDGDIDAGIVTEVPLTPGELPEGTLLKVRITAALSTTSTLQGTPFSATIEEDVKREGRTVIPMGSTLEGTVTEVHGGRRISGRAAIHLEPRRIALPDGTFLALHAQVTDSGQEQNVRVNEEGTIVRRDHAAETLAIVTGTTGAAAVAGALIGGGVGAAVGAGIGAGAGTIVWLRQDRQAALPANTALIFALTTPMQIRSLTAR